MIMQEEAKRRICEQKIRISVNNKLISILYRIHSVEIHAYKMHRWLLKAKLQEPQLKHVVKHEWIQSDLMSYQRQLSYYYYYI